jgi:hypothetical protein
VLRRFFRSSGRTPACSRDVFPHPAVPLPTVSRFVIQIDDDGDVRIPPEEELLIGLRKGT